MTRVGLLAFLLVLACPVPAGAGPASEALARRAAASCIGEAGWREPREGYLHPLDECRAILAVYDHAYATRWRPRGGSMAQGIQAFSSAIRPRARHPRPWLLGLERGTVPSGVGFRGFRRAWEATLALTRRWVAGEALGTPCEGATDYGGSMDEVRPGHEVVVCEGGLTRNTFRRRAELPAPEGS